MQKIPDLILQKHDGFTVVRGDLFPGGIKGKVLASLLEEIKEDEVVYTAQAHGHSGFALGLAGIYNKKKVTLFFPAPEIDTYIYRQAKSLNNVTCVIVNDITHQREVSDVAKKYAGEHKAHYMPIGFDYPPFTDKYIELMKSLPVEPTEVWVSGGSGVTSRCMRKAWPDAVIRTVNLGMMPGADFATPYVYDAPEKPYDEAEILPPYPSALFYDAKTWRFIKQHAKEGALVWNVA